MGSRGTPPSRFTVVRMDEHRRASAALLDVQAGVATFQQLIRCGVPRSHIRAQVDGRRWQRFGDHCVLTHNYTPTRRQRLWITVLEPQGPAALAGLTALESAGFSFFGQPARQIHLLVQRGAKTWRLPEARVHESRRFHQGDLDPTSTLPRTRLPRSALDAGAWQPFPRYACAVLAAVVQQRFCRPLDLAGELEKVGQIRHKAHMRRAIADITGGAEALSELDIAGMCRKFGLQPPGRQCVRKDKTGRNRYLDCEWVLEDGSIVVLEIDGSHHMLVEHWEADAKRERGVVISGRRVLRATASEARFEQAELAGDLEAVGVPRLR